FDAVRETLQKNWSDRSQFSTSIAILLLQAIQNQIALTERNRQQLQTGFLNAVHRTDRFVNTPLDQPAWNQQVNREPRLLNPLPRHSPSAAPSSSSTLAAHPTPTPLSQSSHSS